MRLNYSIFIYSIFQTDDIERMLHTKCKRYFKQNERCHILVHLVRGNELIVNLIQKIDKESGTMYISIVSVGEIYLLAYQFGWGQTKLEAMEDLLTQLLPIPIENKEMAKMYAEIDAYSQHKNPDIAMPKYISPRNMGKMIYGLLLLPIY